MSSVAIYSMSKFILRNNKDNKIVTKLNNTLKHPRFIEMVQFIGYVWPFYSIGRCVLYLNHKGGNDGRYNVGNGDNINTCWIWNGLGAWQASLWMVDFFYHGILDSRRRVFQFLNVNQINRYCLNSKSIVFGIFLLDRYINNYNSSNSNIDMIDFINNLPLIDKMYGLYSIYNLLHIFLVYLFPSKLDDFNLTLPKIIQTMVITLVTSIITGIGKLGNSNYNRIAINILNGINININRINFQSSKNILLNELYFLIVPAICFTNWTGIVILATPIEKNLYLSNKRTASNQDIIKKLNIKHIVEIHRPQKRNKTIHDGINYFVIEIEDRGHFTRLIDYFDNANQFISKAVEKDENVLVHCDFGVSRSSTIVTAYLIGKLGYSWNDAIDRMNQLREQYWPNNGYMLQLKEYYEKLNR